MVAKARILRVGGATIPSEEGLVIKQSYAPVFLPSVQYKMDGSGYAQRAWCGKLKTTISAEGACPASLLHLALDAASVGVPQEFYCVEPRRVQSGSNAILLPSGAYRTDGDEYAPTGFYLAGNGREMVRSATTVASNVATVTAVTGATRYAVQYWPVLMAVITSFEEDVQLPGGKFGWRLTAQEI